MTILPFCLNDIWFGLDLEHVQGVDVCGKIAVMPGSKLPLAGLMQKNGKILPVWSLHVLINEKSEEVKNCCQCIELSIEDKIVVLPVDKVLAVTNVSSGWVPVSMYGLKIYRSLDKKPPSNEESVVEVKESAIFYNDTSNSGFSVEEICSH